ncbi:MAG: tRNA 4-thiouridine(8) synthase ThiI [Deltaproteobacteria bacterium]|nr:tRNA 4-thiouridine(8) synthase ThiI [Deltaproteobacteria bacterium]
MKAICVFSGGLDSMLAAEAIRAQDIDVLALFFETPFFTAHRALASARAMNLPFKVVDITKRHLEVVKHPKHGYGGNMNPCIDCHALMFRIAGGMLDSEDAAFVFSGEVMGQRPMSQNKRALALVAEESGLQGLLLRPLSAKCLPPTIPETKGWVIREQLLGFQGRSRKPQMRMAADLRLCDYPAPAGGCLLTEKGFSRRLRDLLAANSEVIVNHLEALKLGRHFRINDHVKIVVGRNKGENEKLKKLAIKEDILLNTVSVPGPAVLVSGDLLNDAIDPAVQITLSYSDAHEGEVQDVRVVGACTDRIVSATVPDKKDFKVFMI